MTAVRAMLRDRSVMFGLIVLGITAVVALAAPWIAPADPTAQTNILQTRFLAPLSEGPTGVFHVLGTDRFGRDVLSRLLYGARISLMVGFASVIVAVLIGTAVGVTAAVVRGVTERTLMAATDAMLAIPRLVLLLALVAIWEPHLWIVVLVLGATGWMSIARLVRGEVKKMLGRSFIDAATASGVNRVTMVWRHLLPNSMTPVIIAAALSIGNTIVLESGLAFLGLGVPPPAPSWGNMIAGGREALVNAPWIAVFPGFAIVLIVVACNLLGDGLRDALDPTTRQTKRPK